MKRVICFLISLQFISASLFAQKSGNIIGSVEDKNTLRNLMGVTITIEGTSIGTTTDSSGSFKLTMPVGTYTLAASSLGYQKVMLYNIEINSGNDQIIQVEMHPETETLQGIVINVNKNNSAIATDMITPLSVQQLTTQEIKSNPGGNFDVSKVVQTLPGVGLSNGVGERNDIIIRRGAPMKMSII